MWNCNSYMKSIFHLKVKLKTECTIECIIEVENWIASQCHIAAACVNKCEMKFHLKLHIEVK